jgi:two-component system OmpR family sensor kinase
VLATIRGDANGTLLTVEDSGPGLDPALHARAFDRFYRQPGSGAEGSGLGLSIVRRIAELHSATLALSASTGLAGLCVSIRFPAPTSPAEGSHAGG